MNECANRHSGSSNRGAPAGDSGIVWLAPSPSPADPPPSVARPGARPQVYAPGLPPVRHPAVRQPSTPPHTHIDTHTTNTTTTTTLRAQTHDERGLLVLLPTLPERRPQQTSVLGRTAHRQPPAPRHRHAPAGVCSGSGGGRGGAGAARWVRHGSQRAGHSGRNARPRAGSGREIPSVAPGRPSDGSPPSEEAPQPPPGRQTGATAALDGTI